MQKIYFTIITLFIAQTVMGQCFEPDESIWLNTWASCETSPNPKPEYGNTHWIQYNFGSVRTLSKTWAWNTNEPAKLNQGFNLVKIDYSSDGQSWEYWGEMHFPQGTGEAIYSGFPGPDLMGIEAQYVLLTAINNHGAPNCMGLAEIKFNLMTGDTIGLPPPDNEDCAEIDFFEIEEVTETEAFIFWDIDSDIEDLTFIFSYRPVDGDWSELSTEEAEVFLENLEPDTAYEFVIAYECNGEVIFSDTGYFTTQNGSGCAAVKDIWLEDFSSTDALVVWEEAGEGDFYLIQFTEVNSTELNEGEAEEAEILLENLEPNTEYMIRIGIECAGDTIWSEPFFFFTEGNTPNSTTKNQNKIFYKIFPNPTSGEFNFQYSSQQNDFIDYTLTDIMGKRIKSNHLFVTTGTNTITVDINNLPEGIYLFNAISKNGQQRISERLVKLN